jgi:hypothetical protein
VRGHSGYVIGPGCVMSDGTYYACASDQPNLCETFAAKATLASMCILKASSGLPSDRHPDCIKRAIVLRAVKVWPSKGGA